MKPKFKPGDFVKYYNKNINQIIIEQIIGITNNQYKVKTILPIDIYYDIKFLRYHIFEQESNEFTATRLLTDEDKLALL